MSLIGQDVYHPTLGLCRVLDFDKGGQFWLQGQAAGGWYFINEFSREMAS